MRVDRYVVLKYGTGSKKEYSGQEVTIGGEQYVRYDSLADLQKDFPDLR